MTMHGDTNTAGPSLMTFEQNILRVLGRLVNKETGSPFADLLSRKETQRDLTSLQGLLHRAGLLQTALYAARKNSTKEGGDKPEATFQVLRLVATVLHDLWPAGKGAIYGEVFQSSGGGFRFDPQALAGLDLITYERLWLDAMKVTALSVDFVGALAENKDDGDGNNPRKDGSTR